MAKKKKTKKGSKAKKVKKKLGLTMGSLGKLWSNGLDQNVVFLAKSLKKAGFDPYLVLADDKFSKGVKTFQGIKLERYGTDLAETCSKFDVIFFVSGYTDSRILQRVKDSGTKIVNISYGNLFQMFNEAMGVKPDRMEFNFERYKYADAVWVSPHFERNIPWYKTFCGADIEVCPYIWDPLFFDEKCKEFNGEAMWTPEKNTKNIAVHEPNINYLKTSVLPISIVAHLNKRRPELVEQIVVLNSKKISTNKSFIDYVVSSGLLEKGGFESRRSTPFMTTTAQMGTSVFTHINNGLNYLPLELFRLGYPVVHNSEEFRSAGYFYPEIDSIKGAEQLEIAIETHEENFEKQLEAGRELVHKYSMQNPDNIEGYKRLVEKLFDS